MPKKKAAPKGKASAMPMHKPPKKMPMHKPPKKMPMKEGGKGK